MPAMARGNLPLMPYVALAGVKALTLLVMMSFFTMLEASDCDPVSLDNARDSSLYKEYLQRCADESSVDADTHAIAGYFHRHGYGVPRNLDNARTSFETALRFQDCHPYAVCGLKTLAEASGVSHCSVDCSTLAQEAGGDDSGSDTETARERARIVIADLIRRGELAGRSAQDLDDALRDLLLEEDARLNEARQALCTGHIKRAVVTISVAHQLEREVDRRQRLLEHHRGKLQEGQNARSQAAVQMLQAAQERSSEDKQVFFEKYTSAVFSAAGCDKQILARSFAEFEREISEVSVTELEQMAYGLFKTHVEDARNSRGISSDWFSRLSELLQ